MRGTDVDGRVSDADERLERVAPPHRQVPAVGVRTLAAAAQLLGVRRHREGLGRSGRLGAGRDPLEPLVERRLDHGQVGAARELFSEVTGVGHFSYPRKQWWLPNQRFPPLKWGSTGGRRTGPISLELFRT